MTRTDLQAALAHATVRAFLAMLRYCEGTAGPHGHRTMFGGGLFDGYADHPRQAITRTLGGKPITSTAAGAYQFLSLTWDGLVKQYGFPDFSPACQDEAAVALIAGRGALADVIAGRVEQAVAKCAREWASLPGSPYGQPTRTMAQVLEQYTAAGGQLQGQVTQAPAPVEDRSFAYTPEPATAPEQPDRPPAPAAQTTTPGAAMNPAFAIPLIQLLIEKIPEVARLFSSGSPTAERNLQAAEILANVAKDALGARNEQEAVEIITSDPGSLDQVREAVRQNFFELFEAQERSVAAAREHMAAYVTKKDVRTVLGRLTFPELLALIMVVISSIGAGYVLWDAQFSKDLKSIVITAILIGGFVGVREFFFGSSPVEQANNEAVRQAQQR